MAITYVALISGSPSGSSSFTISNIPQTYTDLMLVLSLKTNLGAYDDLVEARINSDTNNYTGTWCGQSGNGTTMNLLASTDTMNTFYCGPSAGATVANLFSVTEIYFPNYATSQRKVISTTATVEANAQFRGVTHLRSSVWSQTGAMSSLYVVANGNFTAGSTFDLYGIKNS